MDRRNFLQWLSCATAPFLLGPRPLAAEDASALADMARQFKGKENGNLRGLIPDGSQANLAPIIAEWEALTGQKVTLSAIPVDDVNARMTMDGLTQRLDFDFALPATFGIADLVKADILQPFEPMQKSLALPPPADESLYVIGDFHTGQRYGYQTDGDVYLMFYRADMMDDPKYTEPYQETFGTALTVPVNWQEFDQQIEFFHNPAEGCYGGALFRIPGYLGWEFFARFFTKQSFVFSNDMHPVLDNDAAEEVLEQMRRASDFLHPASQSSGLFENWALYKSENIYANIGWGGSQKSFNQQGSPIRGKLRHASLPGLREKNRSFFNWGWSYVIPTAARQPEMGYLFARFAVSPQISIKAVREKDGFFDPFHASHYQDPEILQTYSKPFLDVHKAAMRIARHNLNIPGHGAYMASLNRHLTLALDGSLSARQALRLIASEWELITTEIGRDEQIARWRELIEN